MHFPSTLTGILTFLSVSISALNVPPAPVEARDNVDVARALAIAPNAFGFCSSFISVPDVTRTVTRRASPVTVTPTCTGVVKKRQFTTRRLPVMTTSATSSIPTTTSRPSTSSTSSSARATFQCALTGLPRDIRATVCQVMRNVCRALVRPKTVTVTTYKPGKTTTLIHPCPSSNIPPTSASTTASSTTTSSTTTSSTTTSSTTTSSTTTSAPRVGATSACTNIIVPQSGCAYDVYCDSEYGSIAVQSLFISDGSFYGGASDLDACAQQAYLNQYNAFSYYNGTQNTPSCLGYDTAKIPDTSALIVGAAGEYIGLSGTGGCSG